MFTVCSKCNLRLTVTATDLRAAQGYVRCGRCHNVFNALAALADDPARPAEPATAADTQSRQALTPPAPEPQPATPAAPRQPASRDTDRIFATDTSLEFNPASTNINEVFIEAAPDERTGTFESIILGGEELADAEVVAEPVIAPQAPSAPAAAALRTAVDVQPCATRGRLRTPEISFMADVVGPDAERRCAPRRRRGGCHRDCRRADRQRMHCRRRDGRWPAAAPPERPAGPATPARVAALGCYRLPQACWPCVWSHRWCTTIVTTSPTPPLCVAR